VSTHPPIPKRGRRSPEETLALWKAYMDTRDPRLRDRLVLTFAPLVKYIVFKKVREIPARCDVEDFISCGLEALMHSIERYDPERGTTLEQFAWTRIHGAVLDELRRQDWAPRSLRRWERDIERAREEFVVVNERSPRRDELASSLGLTVAELRRKEDDLACAEITSLNTLVLGDGETSIQRLDTIAGDDEETDPAQAALLGAAKDRLREAFERLPRREREVAVMLYVKDLTLREIGDVLGVSESRVCQIHGQLKRTLRAALEADEPLFAEIAA
jgi:RNA polymerase sigma factor for flagellar operon FliA